MWRSIRLKFVVIYLLLMLFTLQLIGAYFVRTLNASLVRDEVRGVQKQVSLLAAIVKPELTSGGDRSGDKPGDASLLSVFPQPQGGAIYLLNSKGVVEDTSAGSALIGQKRIDSVATQALVGHQSVSAVRYDPSADQHLLAVAMPLFQGDRFIGILEDVVSIQTTYSTMRQVTTIFYTGSALVLAFTALLGIGLSRTISRPILDVTRQAARMAQGDFSRRVQVVSDDELGQLGHAVNDLADKLQTALSENLRERERLRAIITYMGDGVLTFDRDLRPVYANEAALRCLPRGADDFARAGRLLGVRRESLTPTQEEWNWVRELDGALLHVHLTAIQREADTDGYVAVIRDVTEQERLYQKQREFVANVSHELRTPLTTIKSYLEALGESGDLDEQTRHTFLDVCRQEADRMVRITQDLLQLSGLETQGIRYVEGWVDAQEWLTAACQRLEMQAKRQGVALDLRPVPKLQFRGDRDLLDRVLDNIIGNALKYTAAGGQVRVRAEREEDKLRVCVEDTGIGIPESDLPHVFERFYRVDKARSRRSGGTGLGLTLAREIIDLHGGRIGIESQLGRGTKVWLLLPLTEGEPA
ncbi:ATP-binding protein [Alicyclobacillus shizuokensis]|uniref:ATP-binding protein n=1 Tax=Alicyclobacillus shizuokensis TaxID=392014 RepID=UPI00082B0C9E|nr:ATP-binding protein [Alicyclobacillus shizuokensis]MCL6626921.1 cell wall metabolism sensor histidine kinase WalK [Alicyclobacillus shizuokensis]